tara:strand:+ start:978 stop:1274 length:297 start_codon:yes stop_codon:yes gene_type:complete
MTNKFSITSLQRTLDEKVVYNVAYKLESTDDNGKVYTFDGSVSLEGSKSEPGFIEFDNLTEADVLAWVYSQVPKSEIEEYTIQMKKQEDNKPSNLPWE